MFGCGSSYVTRMSKCLFVVSRTMEVANIWDSAKPVRSFSQPYAPLSASEAHLAEMTVANGGCSNANKIASNWS